MKYCYADTLSNFMNIEKPVWMKQMQDNIKEICEKASDAQIEAWEDCFDVLREELKEFAIINPDIHIIFEYVLRYTSHKRPDVLLLSEEKLAILEFKRKNSVIIDDRIQTEEYARNLYLYHSETRRMKSIVPILMLTHTDKIETYKEGIVHIVSKGHLASMLESSMTELKPILEYRKWTDAEYRILPTIVEAARAKKDMIELPAYEVVRKAGISEAEECLKRYVSQAQKEKKYILAIVDGVPGAGKTLLGIDLAYETYNEALNIKSTYMSGNGPLVAVLQDALKSDTFVKNIHVYLDQYTDDGAKDFDFNVCIFDEGQRTWTARQRAKKGKKRSELSEAALMIDLIEQRVEWCFLLVLVGTGQEINTGEENGLELWREALCNSKHQWEVLCSPNLEAHYHGCKIIEDSLRERLSLTNSLRSNCARKWSNCINALVDGDISEARKLYEDCKQLYGVYITRDIERAKKFCREHYQGDKEKRYGLLASSQSFVLPKYGVDNTYDNTKQTRTFPARWFNAPVNDSLSCCALIKPITEFGCQGLEIDLPIVCWEKDFLWNGTDWELKSKFDHREYSPKGMAEQYRKNTYRVLLTRGRDGMVIFVPPRKEFDKTYDVLESMGFESL